ncbi:molybdopterin-dependent oxidoreductase [Candidatus Bathyarchaeota archaeon]|nr:molybdopterin-dependent oxidoreductase [Candidatus Bathyarchaeota archaeon]
MDPNPTPNISPSPTPTPTTTPQPTPTPTPTSTPTPIEIRENEGQDLSSIEDFRENSISGPQYLSEETYQLTIKGLVENETTLSYQELISNFSLHKKVVTLYCVEGWDVTIFWEGVLLEDLLDLAGYTTYSRVVIFRAADGYSTSLPRSYLINNKIILAYKMNGVFLPPERGFPLQLVAESKYGYKWIKWITEIEVSDDIAFRGFWESRGWDNNADLP